MHTLTHLVMGGALGSMLTPGNWMAQGAIIAGSIAPDLVLAPSYVLAQLRGEQSMSKQGKWTLLSKEVTHSFPLALALFVLCVALPAPRVLLGFLFAVLLHIMIDILTHCGQEFRDTDQSCAWPFHKSLSKLGSVFGIWEYRHTQGSLRPKPFEIGICLTCIGFWAYHAFR